MLLWTKHESGHFFHCACQWKKKEILKSTLGFILLVQCFTNLCLITFYINIGTLLFYLKAAMLGVVVLGEGEKIVITDSKCKWNIEA